MPEREFDAVVKTELIVNHAQIILDYLFCGSDRFRDFVILQALCDKVDDSLFALIWNACSVQVIC